MRSICVDLGARSVFWSLTYRAFIAYCTPADRPVIIINNKIKSIKIRVNANAKMAERGWVPCATAGALFDDIAPLYSDESPLI